MSVYSRQRAFLELQNGAQASEVHSVTPALPNAEPQCGSAKIQLKVVHQDYDPDLFWQNEAKNCSNFKGPGSTMRG